MENLSIAASQNIVNFLYLSVGYIYPPRLGVTGHLSTTPTSKLAVGCRLVLQTVPLMLILKQESCKYQF